MRVHTFTVPNDVGIEALQRLSQEAGRFRSDIFIEYEEEGTRFRIDVKSILGTMLLALRQGTEVLLRTKGSDEEEAIHWLSETIEFRK
ncbi:MAG TPA: HPr family phosphocarrier protein [Paenibacillus sp.]|nr:HPr family phosphocarrier protein [Paenibacillus sp.]